MSWVSKTTSRRMLLVSLILLLIIAPIIVIPIFSRNINIDEYTSEYSEENRLYGDGFSITMEFLQDKYYKGENISILMHLDVSESYIFIQEISINITDGDRIAGQSVHLNKSIGPGMSSLTVFIKPAFTENGFLALNYGNYTFKEYSITYSQRHTNLTAKSNLEKMIEIIPWPVINGFDGIKWKYNSSQVNLTADHDPTVLTITPLIQTGSTTISASIDVTGYVNATYSMSSLENSTVSLGFKALPAPVDNFIFVGQLIGDQNFSIVYDFDTFEPVNITLSMFTQRIPVFIVNANNHWHGYATDNLYFERPSFYLEQVNTRFLHTFNITLIEVEEVEFEFPSSSDLFQLINTANVAVGDSLNLENNTWNAGKGPQVGNAGIDIELVFTNRTMDHLGIVIGMEGEAYNIAVNARGSGYEGNYRLLSSMADNLIQHELSHIFGAPDRWTSDGPASIMSKSHPEDAIVDIAFLKFWLLKTNWLNPDILTMMDRAKIFLPK